MKKTYKIDVDCANCANLMEETVKKTEGVKDAVVSFMTLKMKVEFEEGADPEEVMPRALETANKLKTNLKSTFKKTRRRITAPF